MLVPYKEVMTMQTQVLKPLELLLLCSWCMCVQRSLLLRSCCVCVPLCLCVSVVVSVSVCVCVCRARNDISHAISQPHSQSAGSFSHFHLFTHHFVRYDDRHTDTLRRAEYSTKSSSLSQWHSQELSRHSCLCRSCSGKN